ncbi:hypothetical protein NDU88_001074 [Pleurodeles waltl]|uniref:Uncharacterized protein n=1 Tax=Pleurodeles waltl TaxID=8319 RepID=A0AAV7P2Q5_PLEWA|nr:hypothetical protein NDU88_001074 [Pleurodeles waltl]
MHHLYVLLSSFQIYNLQCAGAAEDGGCIKSQLGRGPRNIRCLKPDLGAACADRGGRGTGSPAGNKGAHLSRPREDPGSGGDERRRRPGTRPGDRGWRCLGAPEREQTGPPSEAEAVLVTLGPTKRVQKRCRKSREASHLQLHAGAGQGNPRLPRAWLQQESVRRAGPQGSKQGPALCGSAA